MVEIKEINEIQEKRISRWKEKLLDLSLRNRLLNFRETKTALKLEVQNINLLEDKLSGSESLHIKPWPVDSIRDLNHTEDCSEVECSQEILSIENQGFKNNIIYVRTTENELEKRLKEIHRLYRSGLEETGVNTLYIACGFVNWLDPEKQQRKAPIILIPISINRTAARSNYEIKIYEGDSELNITLLEKFRKEFGIDISFTEIPLDDSGVDVVAIITEFRNKLTIPGWSIEETAALGFFSFSRFLMWKDLEAKNSELLKNPIVASLASAGKVPLLNQEERNSSENLFLPLSADSSQKEAVIAAASGKTFILEGPPGTGKSQTITNIIANCIGNGMKVLFVSEKKAALEVVYKRLLDAGLGTWCLELHSNNASRKSVLEQFEMVLKKQFEKGSDDYRELTAASLKLEEKLGGFVKALHESTPSGFSVYQAIEQLSGLQKIQLIIINFGSDPDQMTNNRYIEMLDGVEKFALVAEKTGLFSSHPFRFCSTLPAENLRNDALESLKKAVELLSVSRSAATELVETLTENPEKNSIHFYNIESLNALKNLGILLENSPPSTVKLCSEEKFPETRLEIEKHLDEIDEEHSVSTDVSEYFNEGIYSLNLSSLKASVEKWMNTFFIFAFIMLFFTRWKLKKLAKGELLPNRLLPPQLDKAIKVVDLRNKITEANEKVKSYIGYIPDYETTAKSRSDLQWAGDFRITLRNWLVSGFSPEDRNIISDRIISSACRNSGIEWRKPDKWFNLQEKSKKIGDFVDIINIVNKLLLFDDSYLKVRGNIFNELEKDCPPMIENIDLLRDFTNYNSCKNKIISLNCRPICLSYENDQIGAQNIVSAFKKSFFTWFFEKYSYRKQILRDYNSKVFESDVEKFNEIERLKTKSSVVAVNQRLFSESSVISPDAPTASEAGILMREIKKKRRQMSVRNLFRTIPRLIGTLKPCILMSPLSVAQFIEADNSFFDIVIFDEASQITVHESIGAIARGKQLVVVGDSRQLPPTAFFNKTDDETTVSEDDTEELESILDECNAGMFPSKMLRWHYRSRHESLISFSNKNYYGNNLFTFPSPGIDNSLTGIELVKVEGAFYDKGHSRTNPGEARAVVKEVLRILQDENEKWRSIGIVTFSIAQQRLIEDLLDDAIAENPAISTFFTAAVNEPVFVKNLENVQGDERDIMLFSICYGPDEKGNLSMNFGPLNREGGERRLNVAVTRAREKMIVYTSMTPSMIDITRTPATGPAHLKAFLEFASSFSSGNLLFKKKSSSIADVLSENMAHVEIIQEIGQGSAPLEFGLRKTEKNQFFMGFDFEGPSWASILCTKDREIIRPSVLRGLGWRYHRLSILDFQTNPQEFLKNLKNQSDNYAAELSKPNLLKTNFSSEVVLTSSSVVEEKPVSITVNNEKKYNNYKTYNSTHELDLPENLYDPLFFEVIHTELMAAIEIEGPVSINTLSRRFSVPWKVSRVTKKVLTRIESVLEKDVKSGTVYKNNEFYSLKPFDNNLPEYRISVPTAREYDDILPEELATGCLEIIKSSISILKNDLIKESARQSGYIRLNKKILEHFEKVSEILIKNEYCCFENDSYFVKNR